MKHVGVVAVITAIHLLVAGPVRSEREAGWPPADLALAVKELDETLAKESISSGGGK